jgi:hypothetical protein
VTRPWEWLLAEAIDPVLAGSPFQAGQIGGSRDGEVEGIWCGPYDAARAAALLGRPVEDGVPELAELLPRVFVAQPS